MNEDTDPTRADDAAWELLTELSSETEASLLQGALESAGVPCQVESLKFHAEPVNFGPMSEVRVYVLADQLDEARGILAEIDAGEDESSGSY